FVVNKQQRRSVAYHADHKSIWRFGQGACQLIQRPNFLAIDFIDNPATVRREISVDRVWQNVGQHNDVGVLQVKLLHNEVFEEMTKTQISWSIGFEKVEV